MIWYVVDHKIGIQLRNMNMVQENTTQAHLIFTHIFIFNKEIMKQSTLTDHYAVELVIIDFSMYLNASYLQWFVPLISSSLPFLWNCKYRESHYIVWHDHSIAQIIFFKDVQISWTEEHKIRLLNNLSWSEWTSYIVFYTVNCELTFYYFKWTMSSII
jgi:hypothetical protein